MTTETWMYAYPIAGPVPEVYAYLADPYSYLHLSPLVVSIRDVQCATNTDGVRLCHYRSVERFRLWPGLALDNPLRVTMTLAASAITSDVETLVGVAVRFVFVLAAQGDHTQLTETITIRMPALVRGFVVSQAKAVQQHRAQALQARWADAVTPIGH